MWNRVRSWFAPPLIDDHAKSQMARVLYLLLSWQQLIGIALLTSFGIDDDRAWLTVALMVHAVFSAILVYRGAFFFPRVSTPALWLAVAVFLSWKAYGIHDIAFSMVPLALICSAVLQGKSGLLISTAGAFISGFGVIHAEVTGILVTDMSEYTDYADVAYLILIYSVVSGTLWALIGFWSTLAKRAKANEDALTEQQGVLKASEERFRAIADYTYNWESWVGPDGKLLWVNPAVERVTGYSVDECFAMEDYPDLLIHPDDRPSVRAFLHETRAKANGDETGFRIRRKDDELSWGAMAWQPIVDAHGNDAGYRTSVRDITDKKRADEKHAKLEKRLERSQRMEAIGQLAGGIAHDFNNLLLAIRGNAELLVVGSSLDDADKPLATEISKAADRAADLTSQLLAFSRRQVMKPVPTDINELLGDVIGMLTRLIPEDIDLRFRPKAESSVVSGDPGHLEQIIVNLVVNARDAMPNGGKLVIETSNASNHAMADSGTTPVPGECLVIRVCDTGTGIHADTLEHIFEPFFTTKPTGKGTGLGLSTVFGLVKQHKGVTRVRSEVDVGTEFKVFLPLTSERVREPRQRRSQSWGGGHETVLVVEDEPMVLKLACTILENAGYSTIQCANGQEAFDCYTDRGNDIDLVLSDVVMPVMGGEEVMRRLRKFDPDVRILFTSGYASEGIHTGFILNEGFQLLPKPYGPDELLQKVRTALQPASDPEPEAQR